MSPDARDLFKASLILLILFAAGSLAMLFILSGLATYGRAIPFLGSLGRPSPELATPLLAIRAYFVLGCTFITVSGFALIARSAYVDHILAILAKAVVMIIAASAGILAGHFVYWRITNGSSTLTLAILQPLAITLLIAAIIAVFVRLESLRNTPIVRYVAAIIMIVLGAVLLVSINVHNHENII